MRRDDAAEVRAPAVLGARSAAALVAGALALAGCSGGTATSEGFSEPSVSAAADGSEGQQSAEEPQVSQGPLSFSATTLAGQEMDVSSLAGEPVVLWFWASWCTICRAEAPQLRRVAADLDGQVTFLGVPGLGDESDMHRFVADTGTGGIEHLLDSDGLLWQRFGVITQPAYIFVGADGSTEAFSGALGGDALRERAESLIAG